MEFITVFLYDILGIRAIRKERNRAKKMLLIIGFPLAGFVLLSILLAL